MILDDDYRQKRTRELQARFVARTWSEVTNEILSQIEGVRSRPRRPLAFPFLRAGEVLAPGSLTTSSRPPRNYPTRPIRIIYAEYWYPVQPFETWLRVREGASSCSTRPGSTNRAP